MFSQICRDIIFKLSLEHVVFTDLTLVCVKEELHRLHWYIVSHLDKSE
jgi:hypothetical protein